MNESERFLRRQAEWQRDRRHLSWPETIRQAEQLRDSVVALGHGRCQQASSVEPLAGLSKRSLP